MITQGLMKELEHEGAQTKRILERVPMDFFTWKPHEKSREIGALALHVAQTPAWASRIVSTPEININTMVRETPDIKTAYDLVLISENAVQQAIKDLQKATDEDMMAMWTLKKGEHTFFSLPRVAAIRAIAINHLIHHRGQLTVYLRLLDIPVPGIYGPSADEA
jgi:uncharacterized damage-inducible protein DinB